MQFMVSPIRLLLIPPNPWAQSSDVLEAEFWGHDKWCLFWKDICCFPLEEALTDFHLQQRILTQRQTSSCRLLGSSISQSTFCFSECPGSSSVGNSAVMIITSQSWLVFFHLSELALDLVLWIRSGLGYAQWFGWLFWAMQIRICEHTTQNNSADVTYESGRMTFASMCAMV